MHHHLPLIKALVDHIEENVAEEINISALARSFDISPWHFQRLFKSVVGDSLGGYIRGRRLSRAAGMLRDTDLRVIDIAMAVGFASHEAFTRSFQAKFKVFPKQFRLDKPSVLIEQKPLLTEVAIEFFSRGIRHEPLIVHTEARRIVGIQAAMPSPFNADVGLCEMVNIPWQQLFARHHEIEGSIPGAFCGLMASKSGNFTETELDYIAGAVVNSHGVVPVGMCSHTLPAQQVAMFELFPRFEEDTIKLVVDYVYGHWLQTSGYQRGVGDDYLYLQGLQDFSAPVCVAHYVVPVVRQLVADGVSSYNGRHP